MIAGARVFSGPSWTARGFVESVRGSGNRGQGGSAVRTLGRYLCPEARNVPLGFHIPLGEEDVARRVLEGVAPEPIDDGRTAAERGEVVARGNGVRTRALFADVCSIGQVQPVPTRSIVIEPHAVRVFRLRPAEESVALPQQRGTPRLQRCRSEEH